MDNRVAISLRHAEYLSPDERARYEELSRQLVEIKSWNAKVAQLRTNIRQLARRRKRKGERPYVQV